MSLRADQRDYKNAFKKHYHAYSNWQGTGSNLSPTAHFGILRGMRTEI